MQKQIEQILTSLEVAQMISKNHADLMRDIRRYTKQLVQSKIAFVEFFRENKYKDSKGEMRPCFEVTKKGCEFIAHKLTGIKGTEFTARYIERFHEMEEVIWEAAAGEYFPAPVSKAESVPLKEQLECARLVAEDLGMDRTRKAAVYQAVYRTNGVQCGFFEPIMSETKVMCIFANGEVRTSLKGITMKPTNEMLKALEKIIK